VISTDPKDLVELNTTTHLPIKLTLSIIPHHTRKVTLFLLEEIWRDILVVTNPAHHQIF